MGFDSLGPISDFRVRTCKCNDCEKVAYPVVNKAEKDDRIRKFAGNKQ